MTVVTVAQHGWSGWVPVILGAVLMGLAAVVLFVPFIKVFGQNAASIWDLRSICSLADRFGPSSECSTVSVGFMGGIAAAVLGLILIVVGLVRRGQPGPGAVAFASAPVPAPTLAGPHAQPMTAAPSVASPTSPRVTSSAAASPETTGAGWASPPPVPAPIQVVNPFVAPASQAGWMVGGGSVVAALSMLLPWSGGYGGDTWGFVYPVNLLLAIVLLGVAATQFLAPKIPEFSHGPVAVFAALSVGVGIGIGECGFGLSGSASPGIGAILFLIAAIVATIGAGILEVAENDASSPSIALNAPSVTTPVVTSQPG